MSHLGERLTALIDGELGHDERDRALAHLAICAECRAEADLLRRLKGRLRDLGGTVAPIESTLRGLGEVTPPADLVGRLFAIGEPEDQPAVRSFTGAGSTGPATVSRRSRRPGDTRPRGRAGAAGRRRMPRTRYLLAGAATLAVIGVGSASYAAGGEQGRLPQVSPSLQQFAVEHALTSGDVPTKPHDLAPTQLTPAGAARP